MNLDDVNSLVDDTVALNAVKMRSWDGTWRALGPGEYADMVTRVAHPGADLSERKKSPEWKATQSLHRRVDRAAEMYGKECRPPTAEERAARRALIKAGGGTREAELRVSRARCRAKNLFKPDVDEDYRRVRGALTNEGLVALDAGEKGALRDFLTSALAYAEVRRAFDPGRGRLTEVFPVQVLADALGFDRADFERKMEEDLRILIADEEGDLARVRARQAQGPTVGRANSIEQLEAGLRRYYDDLQRLTTRHAAPLKFVEMSKDWP